MSFNAGVGMEGGVRGEVPLGSGVGDGDVYGMAFDSAEETGGSTCAWATVPRMKLPTVMIMRAKVIEDIACLGSNPAFFRKFAAKPFGLGVAASS